MKHYPKEFGGVLVGRYSEDQKTCVISEMILPKKYNSSKYSFERRTEGLLEKLQAFYDQQPRLIYVGEWHSHPDMSPEPSETDKQAMQEISDHEEVAITSPILLIIGISPKSFKIGAYVQFNNKLHKYEEKR